MSILLRANPQQFTDIKRVIELGKDPLNRVLEILEGLDPPPLRPELLVKCIVDSFSQEQHSFSQEQFESLVRLLVSLHGISRQSGKSVSEVFSALRTTIEAQGSGYGVQADQWNSIAKCVEKLTQHKSIRLTSKAIELAYDYANLVRQSKILTDIRPLYDEEGDKIEGAVVSFTLRLRYDSASEEHEISLAMDFDDITALKAKCERALRKASAAKALLTKDCHLNAMIAGEVSDV